MRNCTCCKIVLILRILLVSSSAFLTQFTRIEAGVLYASPCTLAWNYSPDSSVAGYALYYGITGSGATNRLDVGMTNMATLYNLLASTNYFFYVTDYDCNGIESPPSTVMYYTPQALSAVKLTALANGTMSLSFQAAPGSVCLVEYTPSLNPAKWKIWGSATADSNGNITITDQVSGNTPSRFYRAVFYSNPQILSALAITCSATGTITLQFLATPGTVCRVQYTPSLNSPQWQTLGSATADSNANIAMADQVSGNTPSRFYRAVTP